MNKDTYSWRPEIKNWTFFLKDCIIPNDTSKGNQEKDTHKDYNTA